MKALIKTSLFCLFFIPVHGQQLDSTSYYWWTGSSYNRNATLRYDYDVNDKLLGYKTFGRDALSNWRETSRSTYFYNSQGLKTRLVTMNVDAQGNLDSGSTVDWQYTANGLIEIETRVFWFGNSRIVAQTTNQYTSGGLLDSAWIENNNGGGTVLFLEKTYKYHYDAGKLSREDSYLNGSNGLRRQARIQYTYDAQNRLEEVLSYSWNEQTTNFDLLSEQEYFYTGTRTLADSLKGLEFTLTPGIPSTYKREFTYNFIDSVVLSETFNGTNGGWEPLWKQTFAYRGLGTSLDEKLHLHFMSYPNPATDQLFVQLADPQLATVSIQSMSGQTIKKLVLHPDHNSLDLHDLPTGMYLLHLKAGGKTAMHKFIKQ